MADEDDADPSRHLGRELRGASRLVVDATQRVTDAVQGMHEAIAGGPAILGRPLTPFVKLFSAPVYASIRGIAQLVGVGVDRLLEELEPALGHAAPGVQYDTVRAAINGVLGDQLDESGNALAIPMSLRAGRRTLVLETETLRAAVPDAGPRVLVLVHGSSMDDSAWTRNGHDHGAALARDSGWSVVTVRYNSGRHVSTNGRELAQRLEALVAAWPCAVEQLVLFGFSMGGLVTRAAIHSAELAGSSWRSRLSRVVFLGTPHHGAPLERVGNLLGVLLDVSAYSAPLVPLAQIRSAGVTDLRFGSVRDEDWVGRDRFAHGGDARIPCPLPPGLRCLTIAGTSAEVASGDIERLPGDGLVPVASALGRHADPRFALQIPPAQQHVIAGKHHLDLLDSAEAYGHIRAFLEG